MECLFHKQIKRYRVARPPVEDPPVEPRADEDSPRFDGESLQCSVFD